MAAPRPDRARGSAVSVAVASGALSRRLALGRARQVGEQRDGSRSSPSMNGYRKSVRSLTSRPLDARAIAVPAWTQHQVARRHRRHQRDVDRFDAAGRAHRRAVAPTDVDDLADRALVGARDAHLVGAALDGGREQPGMLEADVRQLPQQVVQQHEAAVERRRDAIVVVDPEHVAGRARPAAAPQPSHTVSTPQASARRSASTTTASSAGATASNTSPCARAAERIGQRSASRTATAGGRACR